MNQEDDLELDVTSSEPGEEDDAGHRELPGEGNDSEESDKKEGSNQSLIPSALAGVFRRKRLILSLVVLVMAVGFVSALLLPRISFFGKGSPAAT